MSSIDWGRSLDVEGSLAILLNRSMLLRSRKVAQEDSRSFARAGRKHFLGGRILKVFCCSHCDIINCDFSDLIQTLISALILAPSEPAATESEESIARSLALHNDASGGFVDRL